MSLPRRYSAASYRDNFTFLTINLTKCRYINKTQTNSDSITIIGIISAAISVTVIVEISCSGSFQGLVSETSAVSNIVGFHRCDYKEWRLLRSYTAWLL